MKAQFLEQVRWVGVIALLLALSGVLLLVSFNQNLSRQIDSLEDQISELNVDLVALKATVAEDNTDTQARFDQETRTRQETEASLSSRIDEIQSDLSTLRQVDFTKISEVIDGLEADMSNILQQELPPVHGKLAELETLFASSHPLNVAYINAEDAFTVFTDAVSYLRQRAIDKQGEIVKLQQQYMASTISKDDFDSQNNQLQVELLQAQLNIDLGTIDKMIASSGFSDMRNDLQRLKDEAQPVVDEMKNLVSTVRVGVIDTTEFQNRYTQVKNAFTQLDELLTQAATAKIVQAANKVAIEKGYDLVLRTKNVIVYRNTAKMTDITDLVKNELSGYL
jgi:Skp family chaperone for outer membrane proteins